MEDTVFITKHTLDHSNSFDTKFTDLSDVTWYSVTFRDQVSLKMWLKSVSDRLGFDVKITNSVISFVPTENASLYPNVKIQESQVECDRFMLIAPIRTFDTGTSSDSLTLIVHYPQWCPYPVFAKYGIQALFVLIDDITQLFMQKHGLMKPAIMVVSKETSELLEDIPKLLEKADMSNLLKRITDHS